VFNIGPQELLVILLVALVIVGPQRLPELARTIGRALNELRRAQDEVTRTIRLGLDETEPVRPKGAPARSPGAGQTAGKGSEGDAAGQPAEGEAGHGAPAEEGVVDVARTLGRGLAEIRRARREVQRTFRIDLDEGPAPPPATPRSTPPSEGSGAAPPAGPGAPGAG
jgi:Tat protein translocase TatB subunit